MLADSKQRYGSFQDCLKAPVHRWFTYPAGYSYKLVQAKIAENRLTGEDWIADPFLGSGTTSLTAKLDGLNSVGIEAHPFVFWVAQTKLNFQHNLKDLAITIEQVITGAKAQSPADLDGVWPDLIYKCFSPENLAKLYSLRQAILALDDSAPGKDLLKLALTGALRTTTTAGAGWPYIAPSKYARRVVQRDAFEEFRKQGTAILADLGQVQFDHYLTQNIGWSKVTHGSLTAIVFQKALT